LVLSCSNNNNLNDGISKSNQLDQTNSALMVNYFKSNFVKNNNSIISKTFFFIMETKNQCQGCNTIKYNYQALYLLEFPLEAVFKYYISKNIYQINNNGMKFLYLNQCFEHYRNPSYFTGENSFYCNICQGRKDSIYINNIYSLPPTLIIILNRGKGKAFDCEVVFPEILDVQNYVLCPQSINCYQLRGVISHLGESGMGGHFIAFCKNRIDHQWYRYNDAIVTLCKDQKNEFKIGCPYILFYECINRNNNVLFDENFNNNIFNNGNNFNIN
jgi:ubiquitin C-terminal hydrolase